MDSEKVEKYEKFINEKLKTDLKNVLDHQESIYSEIAEYLQVKDIIEKMQLVDTLKNEKNELGTPFETKVDLGCNFYVNARIEDTSKIFISIGYGFHLEMTFNEALKFIEKKVAMLQDQANVFTLKASDIKANIKFVLEGLKEIQNLKFNTKPEKNHSLFI